MLANLCYCEQNRHETKLGAFAKQPSEFPLSTAFIDIPRPRANIRATALPQYGIALLALVFPPAWADSPLPPPTADSAASDAAPGRWGAPMDDFISTALAEDPSIERARAAIAAAEDGITAAKWQFGPSPSISRELASGTNRYVNVLRIQQPLYTGGLLSANLNAARTTLRSSQQELLAARLQLKLKIVQTWADWAKARGRADSLAALREAHQQLLDMIQRRYKAGVATHADAALAASRLSAVQAEVAQAALEEALQRDRLQRLSRRPVGPALRTVLDGELPEPPALTQVLDRIQLSPEMTVARANVDLARDELAKAKAALMPTVSLRFDHQSGAYRDQRLGLVFQASLQGGLAGLAGMNAARSRIAAAEAAVAATEQDQISNYQLEYTRYAAAVSSLRNAALTAATSDEVLASYRRQFDAGKRPWLDLLNMVREAHATRQSQRDAGVDERAGLYRLTLLLDGAPSGD